MKKSIVAIAFGMGLSSFAAAGQFVPDATNGLAPVSTTNCTLLGEGVNVAVSKEVQGGYACDTGTNQIAVSFCHPNGMKSGGGTNNNFYSQTTAGGKVQTTNDAACAVATAETKANTLAGVVVETPEDPPAE